MSRLILLRKHKPLAPDTPLRPEGPGWPGRPGGPGKPIKKHKINYIFIGRKNYLPGTPAVPLAPAIPKKW